MSDGKEDFIRAYFDKWDRDAQRAAELAGKCLLEGILTLNCYLGALVPLRFPTLPNGEAYIRLVLEYSGKPDFFEQIDLLISAAADPGDPERGAA